MYCPHCGHLIPDNSNFCPACGTHISREESKQKEPVHSSGSRSGIKNGALIVVIAAAAGIGTFFLVTGIIGSFHDDSPSADMAAALQEENNAERSAQTAAGCSDKYHPGTYTAVEQGNGGDVTVVMTFSDDAITSVTASGPDETEGIGSKALESVPGKILDQQSAQVDSVSGATITSRAIMEGAEDCILQAGTCS